MAQKAMIYVGKEATAARENVNQLAETVTVLADYGPSLLVQAEDEGLQTLRDAGYRVRLLPEAPVVQMRGFELNTAHPASRATTASVEALGAPAGESRHVLRLIG